MHTSTRSRFLRRSRSHPIRAVSKVKVELGPNYDVLRTDFRFLRRFRSHLIRFASELNIELGPIPPDLRRLKNRLQRLGYNTRCLHLTRMAKILHLASYENLKMKKM